jgi:hypothetical protein
MRKESEERAIVHEEFVYSSNAESVKSSGLLSAHMSAHRMRKPPAKTFNNSALQTGVRFSNVDLKVNSNRVDKKKKMETGAGSRSSKIISSEVEIMTTT